MMIYDKWYYRAIAYIRHNSGVFHLGPEYADAVRTMASELRALAAQRKSQPPAAERK